MHAVAEYLAELLVAGEAEMLGQAHQRRRAHLGVRRHLAQRVERDDGRLLQRVARRAAELRRQRLVFRLQPRAYGGDVDHGRS